MSTLATPRRPVWIASLALVAVVVALPANAVLMGWEGDLSFDFVHSSLPPLVWTGAGIATLNPGGGGVHLTGLTLDGGIQGADAAPVTDPAVSTLASVQGSVALGAGVLRPFAPLAAPGLAQLTQAAVPVSGMVRLCLVLAGCTQSIDTPLTASGGAVGLGIGGTFAVAGTGPVAVTLQSAPWTVRTATLPLSTSLGGVVTVTARGWQHGPVSLTSSTVWPGGALSVVTPLRVTSQVGQATSLFARLQLRFVPEPSAASGLATGAVVLGWLGWRRARRPPT